MGWIDAHVHVWTSDHGAYPLASGFEPEQMRPASFTPAELFSHCRPAGVDRVVLIQMSFYRYDNRYMLDAIANDPEVFRGVAVVDLEAPDLAATMRSLKAGGVRGFRVGVGGRDIATWAEEPGFQTLFDTAAQEGLAVCPLIEPAALPSLSRMCDRYPDTTVVIDHLCRIGVDGVIGNHDVASLCAMARHKRVYVKLSAFYALGRKTPPHDELLPLIEKVVDAFGVEWLMWASDCPYQVQEETYEDGLSLIRDRLRLDSASREQLLRGTAEQVFFNP